MKLIKIKNDYIIVDDSRIKEGDFKFCLEDKEITKYLSKKSIESDTLCENCKKITYSTEPLEDVVTENSFKTYKFISKQEIEELLFGYNVEKMADKHYEKTHNDSSYISYVEGFNAHKELVKDKLFTLDDVFKVFKHGILFNQETVSNCKEAVETEFDLLIKSLQSTEWDVEFINGKLTLKH